MSITDSPPPTHSHIPNLQKSTNIFFTLKTPLHIEMEKKGTVVMAFSDHLAPMHSLAKILLPLSSYSISISSLLLKKSFLYLLYTLH